MERNQVEKRYTWNTEELFASDEDWEKAFADAEKGINFSSYAGKLGDKKPVSYTHLTLPTTSRV